jgi:hypothetical protein
VQAFADHDAEDLFVDLLVVMHNHWPARDSADHQQIDPAAPGYAFASDIAGYEPLIADILANGDLLDAVVATAPTLGALTVNGKPYERVLMDVVRHFVRPSPGLAHRDGTRTSTTADGRPVNVLTPWQLLADAYQRKRARLAETGADGLAWQDSFSELIDVLARGQDDPVAGWRFRNPRLPGVSVAVLQFVEDRLRARDQSPGERSQWLRGELPDDIEDLLAGPIVPAAGDLVAAIADNPDAVRELNALIAYLADEQAQGDSFRAALSAIGDVVQLAVDDADMLPLARVVGAATDPANGWVDAQLSFFPAARAADDNATLVALLRHAFTEVRPTHTAVGDIIDAISEVDRVRPFGDLGARYTADDYRQAMDAVAHFLDDERRGLRKFIAIIRGRTP